jgi:hypothetical protein
MDYQYNNGIRYDPQADSDHYWVFGGCIKNISPDRPPILNYDNISSEAGVPVNDPNEAAQVDALSMNINVHLIEHAPSSYPSINDGSVSSPNGPERKDLNNFLPVAPATGLGEMQHRRRESFDDVEDQLSYSLRKWARTLPAHARSFDPSWEGMQGGWLRQDTHIVGPTDSVRATRGKSCGSASVSPGSMYSSASPGWRSPNTYHLNEMGTWTIGSPLGGWPLEIEEEAISTNTIPFIKANASRLSSDSFVSSDLHHITPKLAGRVAFRCFNVPETPRLRELSW